jgi:two-component system cell cycle sensor histidine kinase/response regulator CckA
MKNKASGKNTFHELLPAETVKQRKHTPLIFKGNILIMDDLEIIRFSLYLMLSGHGFKAHLTSNGSDAIESYIKAKVSGQPFDAVIMDLNIPGGMGGKETIKKLLEIDPEVRAIVLSGNLDNPVMTNYWEYGFKGALHKPYAENELIQKLYEIIQ